MAQYKTISSKIEVNTDRPAVFSYIFKRDLLLFFESLPCVPLFIYTPFAWGLVKPGFSHVIYFADGSSVSRRLLSILPDISFNVIVEDLDLFFLWGLKEIEYRYYFIENEIFDGCTQIISEYKFKFRSAIWRPLFSLNSEKGVQRHLDAFLKQLHDDCVGNTIKSNV
jgi:hypothetical protein